MFFYKRVFGNVNVCMKPRKHGGYLNDAIFLIELLKDILYIEIKTPANTIIYAFTHIFMSLLKL